SDASGGGASGGIDPLKAADELGKLFSAIDDSTWSGWAKKNIGLVLLYAAQNPMSFVYYVLLALSPLFILSAICAYKLAKDIESKEKDQKRKQRREVNIKRSRAKKDS
ncbi:hypothetical protein BOX15_Mlig007770g2, partial [Macrostomum lignano]